MTTMQLDSLRNEVALAVLQTESVSLLDKIKRLISREEKKNHEAEVEPEEPLMTKEEILCDFDRACKELKLNLDGKLEFRPVEEVLNEL